MRFVFFFEKNNTFVITESECYTVKSENVQCLRHNIFT